MTARLSPVRLSLDSDAAATGATWGAVSSLAIRRGMGTLTTGAVWPWMA